MTSTSLVRFTAPPLGIAAWSTAARADGGLTLALAVGTIIASRIAAHNSRSVELILLKDIQKKMDLLLDSNMALLRGQEAIIRRLAELPGEIADMLKRHAADVLINSLLGVQEQTLQAVRLRKKHGNAFLGTSVARELLADARRDLNINRFRLYKTNQAYSPAVLAIVTMVAQADLLLLNLLGWSEVAEDLIDNVYLPWFRRAVDESDPVALPAYRRKAEAERKTALDQILKTRLGKPLIEGQKTILGASIVTVDQEPEYRRVVPPRMHGPMDTWDPGYSEYRPARPRKKDRIWFDVSLERVAVEQTAAMRARLTDAGADLAAVPAGTSGIEWLTLTASSDKPHREMVAPNAAFPSAVPPQTTTQHVDIADDARRLHHMLQQTAWTNAKVEVAALASAIDTVNLASARIGLANQVEASVQQSIEHLTRIRRTYS
jgi:hypothetical protein